MLWPGFAIPHTCVLFGAVNGVYLEIGAGKGIWYTETAQPRTFILISTTTIP